MNVVTFTGWSYVVKDNNSNRCSNRRSGLCNSLPCIVNKSFLTFEAARKDKKSLYTWGQYLSSNPLISVIA